MRWTAWAAVAAGVTVSTGSAAAQDSVPAAPAYPPYADTTAFVERELTFGEEPYVLPATLTLPRRASAAQPVPVVVLVHGSGPHDRDETIGRRKPLRDLAWGLASRGIGVLRYDKRTRLHAARMHRDSVRIEQETVADALAALDAARAQAETDGMRVYLLGHSLGAMIAPEIAVRDSAVAGVVMMAAGARPLAEMILEQLDYVVTLPENASPAAQAQIGKLRALVERVATGEAAPEDAALGAPAAYFYDLDERAAPARALAYPGPMFLLQGERDYQVTMEDFRIWQETLGGRTNVVLRSYPALDHLFVEGTGKPTPVEMMTQPGFVSAEVVADIAAFILSP